MKISLSKGIIIEAKSSIVVKSKSIINEIKIKVIQAGLRASGKPDVPQKCCRDRRLI